MKEILPSVEGCFVWKAFSEYKDLELVTRAGFGVCGAYPFDLKNAVWRGDGPLPAESDLEHTAGVMKLARLVSWKYPEVIPKEKLDDYLFGAEIHEIGERLTGDILDDGTRDSRRKDIEETIDVEAYLSLYAPSLEHERGMRLFKEFRDKSTEFGRTLYCLDKTEAILQGLFYESKKYPCLLRYKQENFGGISDKDKNSIEAVGSDNIVDCWSYGLYKKAGEKFEHIDVFLEIIQSAVFVVRSTGLTWVES